MKIYIIFLNFIKIKVRLDFHKIKVYTEYYENLFIKIYNGRRKS